MMSGRGGKHARLAMTTAGRSPGLRARHGHNHAGRWRARLPLRGQRRNLPQNHRLPCFTPYRPVAGGAPEVGRQG